MNRILLVVGVLGLLSLPAWPAEWRLALALGWCVSLYAEDRLAARRRRALAAPGSRALLNVMVLGFLGRLALLSIGAIVGETAALFPAGPFLGAFLVAVAVGEAVTLPGLARSAGASRAADRPHDS